MNCRRMPIGAIREPSAVIVGAASSAIPEVYRETLTALGLPGGSSA